MIKLITFTFYRERETKEALIRFIRSAKQLSFGKQCVAFEKNLAAYQGRKECVFFNSGSSANLALLQALLNLGRLPKNAKIGFSAVTWSTNVMPIIQLGLRPVPVDIEPETANVSSVQFEAALKKTPMDAFFLTNVLGLCSDIDRIARLCKENGIMLLEDNCESLGTVYKGKKLGNFGYASTFSSFVGHHLSTIEGGAVCTDDTELATMLRLVRAHGWDRNMPANQQKRLRAAHRVEPFYGLFTFYDLAYNLRSTEIQGFLGNYQLKLAHENFKKRNENFLKLAEAFYRPGTPFFPMKYEHIEFLSSFAFPLIARNRAVLDRAIRAARGKIEIRPILAGNMVRPPFYKKYVSKKGTCPNADIIHHQGFYFANNPDLTKKDLAFIVKTLL